MVQLLLLVVLSFLPFTFLIKKKMTLIDKCYANGGYPEIDSKDKAGAKGTTDGGAATKAGGYKFECKKKEVRLDITNWFLHKAE
ncbi:hypothetical protein OL548_16930 [Lysinibacillus sp. MHQ-1]|nr:hypothetical protein OL548_16930 [Lysinibacillus sp. MHQ-1]